jgi:hypothetical protein
VHASGKPKPERGVTSKVSSTQVQTGFFPIIVNGRTLTGPNSAARTLNNRMMIPAASLARVLGDQIAIDAVARIVSVRRQTGSSSVFAARLGQVRENAVVVLTLSNVGEIAFSPNVDELMLPVEIASTLFDVSIRLDQRQNAVLVDRGKNVVAVTEQRNGRGIAELYQADYEYTHNRYSGALAQNLVINAAGRLADGRFIFTSNTSGASIGQFTLRNASFNLERPNGQRFIAGDIGSGSALPLITANIRGGLVSVPVGDYTVAAFGGRANSGYLGPIFQNADQEPIANVRRTRFDTNVFGTYVTARSAFSQKNLAVSAGLMNFSGPVRSGELASVSANYAGANLSFQADVGIGNFKGVDGEGHRANGYASAVDLSATYQLAENLAVQGRYLHIGANFLTPQFGVREPLDLKAAAVTWAPLKWLTVSFNASTAKRPHETGRSDNFATASFGITPGGGKPRLQFSHTQSSSKQYRSGAFTLVQLSKDFHRWRLYASATRIKTIGRAAVNANFGANVSINDSNSFEINQGFGGRRSLNGMIEWRTSGYLNKRLSLTAGFGYSYSPTSKINTFEKLTATLTLPRQASLNVSYIQNNAGPTILVQIRGTLFRKKEAATYMNARPGEANNFSSVNGRVYQDVDGNGRYDAGTDKPQANVKVRVDGNRYVETDPNGVFAFDPIAAGDHKIYLDLLSVRADLTMVDGDARFLTLTGGKTHNFDFRLVRTGRLTGRVWHDSNTNGKFDNAELPLGDIRIVTSSGRDTLTDTDGYFAITDLAPGEHLVFIDEKTLPEKSVSAARSLAVQVFAGRETGEINLCVVARPAEIKRFGTPGDQ